MRFALCLLFFLFFFNLDGQEALCQGAYWSTSEAEQKLAEWSASWHTKAEWEARAETIKAQLIKGMQWDKMPGDDLPIPKVLSAAVKHLNGYTVTNMAIETFPGFYVTGNLYAPADIAEQHPLILCPHGHWNKPGDIGRFRSDMQMRCATLATLGAKVFAYDMVGYGESTQVTHHISKALLLQTWNSKRILDYFLGQANIDSARVAITGASGGGTQSFMITALDHRIKVSVPVVMVSAHFFGGCVCESGMPVHRSEHHQTNNVEIAALAAPRPMLLISNGHDWTAQTPDIEYPYLQKVYSLFHAKSHLKNVHLPSERHDYGLSKRSAMYAFLARTLDLDLEALDFDQVSGKYDESFVTLLSEDEMKIFSKDQPMPAPMLNGDSSVLDFLQHNYGID